MFLTVLGFGMGNSRTPRWRSWPTRATATTPTSTRSNEARKVLVEQLGGTLVTIAKDVKIQIEFNPAQVAAYRLIGYENRMLAHEDFNDDKKDAGEIGAGHTVTALYEMVPAGKPSRRSSAAVDPLKYQKPRRSRLAAAQADESADAQAALQAARRRQEQAARARSSKTTGTSYATGRSRLQVRRGGGRVRHAAARSPYKGT